METAPLKTFATTARTQLVKEVTARLGIVLQESSLERRENLAAISQLEKAVQSEGAGSEGRRRVAERVAYTWFNRIVALRFMDANGYTEVGVVSPAVGQTVGQPEVLAEAKRGQIDRRIVTNNATVDRVTGLLNGTLTSDDPQREAYGVLLTAYCRYWNRAMPFMFEHEGDYTELLMPADLLSDESIIAKAVSVLTPEVCEDVEVIGWIYQFYIAERKDEVFAGFKKGLKAGVDEIPAATQLFTPHWIVRYLVENSLGRLWLLNRPDSKLAEQMDYYIAPIEAETDYLKVSSPEELKILDPACGSGHMLTYAFDLLYAMYEEEGYAPTEIPTLILTNNLYGTEIDPRAGALAAFALTMKGRAKQRTFLNKAVTPNICVLEPIRFTPDELVALVTGDGERSAEKEFFNQFADVDTFGSLIRPKEDLIGELGSKLALLGDTDLFVTDVLSRASRVLTQAEYLSSRYHVVVTNPPYMGSKNMSGKLSEWAKHEWPISKSDLFAMFIERCLQLVIHDGYIGMITMQSWMFLSSYEKLREHLLSSKVITSMAHLGANAFDTISGEVVSTTAFIVKNRRSDGTMGSYIRLSSGPSEAAKQVDLSQAVDHADCPWLFQAAVEDFRKIPGSPIVYWFTQSVFDLFASGRTVASIARAAKGLVTADNQRFVREWSEVSWNAVGVGYPDRESANSSGKRWFPYAKGGEFRRWAGKYESVVDWYDDGREIQTTLTDDGSRVRATNFNLDRIFKRGLTWTVVTTGGPSFRVAADGFLYDAAAGVLQSANEQYLLGLLNSVTTTYILDGLNPTINLHPGYLGAVPLPVESSQSRIEEISRSAVEISMHDWDIRETSWNFAASPLIAQTTSLELAYQAARERWRRWTIDLKSMEEEINRHFIALFGLENLLSPEVSLSRLSLDANPSFRYKGIRNDDERERALLRDSILDFLSYAVGCMFGRYCLESPGLVLMNQGDTLQDYLKIIPNPSFAPDGDNVIPVLGDDWFDDDVVERFRKFLRIAFGDEGFEENLRFIERVLGKDLGSYFVTDFYKDHVQRYKKRPIYWLFSSPEGSFNALIYMHRYSSSTVGAVLNEYLREFQAKLRAELGNQTRISGSPSTSARDKARADKEVDRIRKMLLEVEEYEHNVLYPLATQQITIDLDDGVKANYPKFGAALKGIPGLESASD